MSGVAEGAIAERATGGQPSRTRSLLTATMVGAGAAVVVYKILRSGQAQG